MDVRELRGRVARVAGEGLVAAVAGERDRDVLPRHLREALRRDRGAVGEGLSVVADRLATTSVIAGVTTASW